MPLPSHLTAVVDTVLDRSVVLGYSRVGYALRRRWWPADPAPGCLADRTVVLTGGSSGLGAATAAGLAGLGATVRLVGRTRGRLEDSARVIRRCVPDARLELDVCDVSDLDAVRAYAASLPEGALHALVHVAGVMPPERSTSTQGHELALATHVLGPLLLTTLLRERLAAAEGARVVWVSSGGMYTAPVTDAVLADLEYAEPPYSAKVAYARTKRMQVVLASVLGGRLAADGTVVHSMHPGWADTPGVQESMPGFARVTGPILRTAEQGADTIVWLAAADGALDSTGEFWCDRRPRPASYLPGQREDDDVRGRLWDACAQAAGLADG